MVKSSTAASNDPDPDSDVSSGDVEWTVFPGIPEKVPSLEWCMEHEFCCTLDDYLRRRTNIAQWSGREGLGRNNENLDCLMRFSRKLAGDNERLAEHNLTLYANSVKSRFDHVIGQV